MKNKFVNLLLQELSFGLKICALLLFIILSLFFQKDARLKAEEAAKLQRDKITAQNLERQIPGLEDKLKGLEEKSKTTAILKSKANFVLKGIITKDGQSTALIEDDIYQTNDPISGLIITSITSNTVTFKDQRTGEQSKMQLPE